MKKSLVSVLFLAAFAFVLVFALGTGDASAMPNWKESGLTSCAGCHDDGRTPDNPTGAKAPAPASDAGEKEEAAPAPAKTAASSSTKVELNNLGESTSVTARTISGKQYLPLRKVVEFFGAKVTGWDNTTKTAIVQKPGKTYNVKPALVGSTAYALTSELAGVVGAVEEDGTLERGKHEIVDEQWATTKHNPENLIIDDGSPSMRDNCIACHDGEAFQKNVKTRAELSKPEGPPTGQDCSTCHGPRGKEIRNSGKAELPQVSVDGAGRGALCMSCHNARKVPTPGAEKLNAPHGAAVSGMLFGVGGWEVPGVTYENSPHAANPDTCISCHMAEDENGISRHTFAVDSAADACGSCHDGLETVNRTALGDYNGNGTIEGIQDEVKGLTERVHNALVIALGENSYHESHGGFVFEDKDGNKIEPTETQYRAAWNIAAAEVEGSWGVHNPAYIVKLLQSSFKELMGYDVPDAAIR